MRHAYATPWPRSASCWLRQAGDPLTQRRYSASASCDPVGVQLRGQLPAIPAQQQPAPEPAPGMPTAEGIHRAPAEAIRCGGQRGPRSRIGHADFRPHLARLDTEVCRDQTDFADENDLWIVPIALREVPPSVRGLRGPVFLDLGEFRMIVVRACRKCVAQRAEVGRAQEAESVVRQED